MPKGADDVTDPPRPVAMTTSGQAAIACHIILCMCVCVDCEATKLRWATVKLTGDFQVHVPDFDTHNMDQKCGFVVIFPTFLNQLISGH